MIKIIISLYIGGVIGYLTFGFGLIHFNSVILTDKNVVIDNRLNIINSLFWPVTFIYVLILELIDIYK